MEWPGGVKRNAEIVTEKAHSSSKLSLMHRCTENSGEFYKMENPGIVLQIQKKEQKFKGWV